MAVKRLVFLGSSRADLRALPKAPRRRAGHDLDLLQHGFDPSDVKPMPSVGAGIYELRIRVQGAYRVFYVAKFAEAVYVLHVFQKKSQRTTPLDLRVGTARYRALLAQRRGR
ncbi:MAG: type II toxin-antitoxin system RelE/ParE family toxin [Vicinamibacterales bacterium]